MAEPPVSSSSLPSRGSPLPESSFVTPQSSRYAKLQQPILPSILPLTTQSPVDDPIEFNLPPSGAWSGFGDEEEFPPLTSGSPFLATVIPPSPCSLFEDLTEESDMDTSGPIGSDGIPVSTEEYQLFPEKTPHMSAQSSPSVSLIAGYRSLG